MLVRAYKIDYVHLLLYSVKHPKWTIKLLHQYNIIKKSKLFNHVYYTNQFKYDKEIKFPLLHYILNSVNSLYDPNEFFDTNYYIKQKSYIYKIISEFRISPLYHYLKYGIKEDLNPNIFFNLESYIKHNPDIKSSNLHPFTHYVLHGKKENRITSSSIKVRTNDKILNYNGSNNYKHRNKVLTVKRSDLVIQRKYNFVDKPLISVIIPVYNPPIKYIKNAISSVINQSYSNWELVISDCSNNKKLSKLLKKYNSKYPNIHIYSTKKRLHISENSNNALKYTKGEFIALLDQDDLLPLNTFFELAKYMTLYPDADIFYSDEDKIDNKGKLHTDPFYKPDWSPDTLMSIMYTSHLTVYRKSILTKLNGFRVGYEGAQDYDLMLRASELTNKVCHIPEILYHWRINEGSIANNIKDKEYAIESLKKAKKDAFKRRGLNAILEESRLFPGQFYPIYQINKKPLVSIIIPIRDKVELLKNCLNSLTISTYTNVEIIIIDNMSTEAETINYLKSLNTNIYKVLSYNHSFNYSSINNFAVEKSNGEYLVFLNNDTEVITTDWIERMLGYAQLSHIGAVGAQLLFPDRTIQHCGLINLYDGPGHALYNYNSSDIYHFGRNDSVYNWIAVTAACLMISKKKFIDVNCFDEKFPIAYNDVDICFKLINSGLYNVCINSVKLFHHESKTRGIDHDNINKMQRLLLEKKRLYDKHNSFFENDPFYNKNLSHSRLDFSLEIL